jgi:hypothetical protein
MTRALLVGICSAVLVTWAAAAPAVPLLAADDQAAAGVIGTIRLAQPVMADGKRLPAGTYHVRLTSERPAPAVGESPGGEQWVEFMTNATVAGREVATVVSASDIAAIAKGSQPAPDTSRVDALKDGDYIRVWINRSGMHYLINLPPAR